MIFILFFHLGCYFENLCCWIDKLVWGSVADWFNIVVVLGLAWLVYRFDKKRARESEKLEKNLSKPIITFQIITTKIIDNASHQECEKEFYKIFNYGKGTALNVTAAYKNTGDSQWQKPVKCYSVKEGDGLILCWNPKMTGEQWIVRYFDSFERTFYTICKNDDILVIEAKGKKYKPKALKKECEDFESFLKDNENSIKRLWEIDKDTENYCKDLKDKNYT